MSFHFISKVLVFHKKDNELYNQKYLDINLNPDIEDKLDDIYYNMIKEKTDNNGHAQDNINEHLKIDFDMFYDSKNFVGINKNIITSEINISPKDKIPWFFSVTNINNFKELSNEEDIMNLHEIQLKNNISNNIQKCNDEQNINKSTNNNIINNFKNEITEDKLKNLGFKSLLGGNIFMKNKNIIINNGFDLLNKKREREKYIKKLYKNNINDIEEEKMIMDNGQYNGNIYKEQNQQKKIKGRNLNKIKDRSYLQIFKI